MATAIGRAGLCALALGCAAPAPHRDEALGAQHERYAEEVADSLTHCLAEPWTELRVLSPGLAKLCTCFVDYRPTEPELHVIELRVAADGKVRAVSEAASGPLSTFGYCRPDELVGL